MGKRLPALLAAGLVLASLLAAGCGGPPDGKLPQPTASRSTASPTPPPVPTPPASSPSASATPSPSASPSPSPSPTATGGTTGSPSPSPSVTPPPPPDIDTVPPEIVGVAAIDVQANQATIRWTIEEDKGPVTSRVEWGIGPAGPLNQPATQAQPGSGMHQETLTGLASNTTHRARIVALDSRNQAISDPPISFRTLAVPPLITNITVSNVRDTSFTVSWTQAGSAETRSRIAWGTSASYGLGVSPDLHGPGTKSHTLTGLAEDTLYHFRITADSASGTRNSGDQTQSTANLVAISITGNPGALRFGAGSTQFTSASDLLLVRVTYNAGSGGGPHSWELHNSTGAVVPGFQSIDLIQPNQVWESGALSLAPGNYSMHDRQDAGATGTWNVS